MATDVFRAIPWMEAFHQGFFVGVGLHGRMKRAIITAIWKGKKVMEEQEGKWDRLEHERLQIRPETFTQLELLAQTLRKDTVDEAIRTLLSTQTFALHTM